MRTIAYLVTIASTLLTFGRLSDMVGRKPVWLSGLALFTLGSAVCGAANSLSVLIAARAFQGLGGALLLSTSVAIITDSFSFDKRGFALGCNAVVIALGASAGPALGGFITEHWSWRWIFYVNLPIGICGFVGSQKVLRHTLSICPPTFRSARCCLARRRLCATDIGAFLRPGMGLEFVAFFPLFRCEFGCFAGFAGCGAPSG